MSIADDIQQIMEKAFALGLNAEGASALKDPGVLSRAEKLEKNPSYVREVGLEDVLLSSAKDFDIAIDGAEHLELRKEAASAIESSRNINYYPYLRKSAMTDPNPDVRAIVRRAETALEEEFGEEECFRVADEINGGIRPVGVSLAAQVSGNAYSADMNDFR